MKYKKLISIVAFFIFVVAAYIVYSSYKENLKWENYFKRTTIGTPNELVLKFFDSKKGDLTFENL